VKEMPSLETRIYQEMFPVMGVLCLHFDLPLAALPSKGTRNEGEKKEKQKSKNKQKTEAIGLVYSLLNTEMCLVWGGGATVQCTSSNCSPLQRRCKNYTWDRQSDHCVRLC